jgi:glyoxylase-like metal-dependent hydrolase (beta-lactamase superfamily II)
MKSLNLSHLKQASLTAALALTFALAGAGITNASAKDTQQPSKAAAQTAYAKVDRFTVEGAGSVNTYWITTPQGLIVMDFQRDTDSAAKAIAQIQATGQPVIALLLTHAHPDHIGGIDQFKRAFPSAQLYASQASADEVKNDTTGYQKMGPKFLGDKAPQAYPLPDRILKNNDRLVLGGLVIEARELGKGESESATVFYLPQSKTLFSGDVVANRMIDFMLEQGTGKWLKQIDRLSALYPQAKVLYPGHGAAGEPKLLIAEQRANLKFFREQVRLQMAKGAWNGKELSDDAAKAVAAAFESKFPGYLPVAPLPGLLELNAKAVATELQRR